MSEGRVTCPRCNRQVDELRFVPPDLLTRDIMEEVESPDQDLTDEDGLEICSDCMADVDGN